MKPTFTMLLGATILASIAAAPASPFPHRKAGLWETDMKMGGESYTSQSCVDAASEEKMSILSGGIGKRNCSSRNVAHNLDGSWTETSTCTIRGEARTSTAQMRGDFNSRLTVLIHNTGTSRPDTSMTLTWMGPCKAGMRPGDVIMSNGIKVNMLDENQGH